VCLVPRRTIMCERVLEEEGVYNAVQVPNMSLICPQYVLISP